MTIKNTYEITVKELTSSAWSDVTDTIVTGPTRTHNGKVVHIVDVHEVNATVKFTDGTKVNWRKDAEVVVLREEPTEEERESARLHELALRLKSRLTDGVQDKARALLDEAIEKSGGKGDYLTGWNLEKIITAQSLRKVYLSIQHSYDTITGLDVVDDDTAVLAAYGNVFTYYRSSYSSSRSPWNGSTSVGHNLIEATDRWAYESIFDRIVGVIGDPNSVAGDFNAAIARYESARDARKGVA